MTVENTNPNNAPNTTPKEPPMSTTEAVPPIDPGDGGGKVGRYITSMVGKSWKTTLAGTLTMGCAVVGGLNAALPGQLPTLLVALCGVIGPFIGGAGLFVAKDHNVTGGTRSA